jgi:hypothetical protein
VSGTTARFAGPFGVDCNIHAFATGKLTATLQQDQPQRWVLRLSQPVPPPPKPEEPAEEDGEKEPDEKPEEPAEEAEEKEPLPPVADYLTVVCPIRRPMPGEKDVRQYAAPTVDKLAGVTGVRISHGKTVRHIFLSEKEVEYNADGVYFKGRRGVLTVRKTHCDVLLFDGGVLRYRGTGVKTDHAMVQFRIAPGGYVEYGMVSGPQDKNLVFYGLGRSPSDLSFRIDGREYLADKDEETAGAIKFGVRYGVHAITVHPKD